MRSIAPRFLRRLVAVLVLVTGGFAARSVFAQAPTPTGTLAPGVNPDDAIPELIFSDTTLEGVLSQLEFLTGRIVLRPQALPSPLIALKAKSLTRAEAVFAIETVLSLNGIGLVPTEDRFLKVVPIQSVRTEAPELYVGSLRDLPASGRVVSKLFRLQHIDTATFQAQVSQFLTLNSIVPFQNSNAVVVTDTVANLQRLEYVVEEVDRQVSIETKFYPISYAKPSELAQQIRTMLDSARSSLQGTAGGVRGAVQPGQPPAPGTTPIPGGSALPEISGLSLQSVLTSNTSITPDDRTYQIIVITNPANLPFFDNLIAKLDVAADPLTSIEVIPMNYAKADELAGLLSDFISGRSSSSSGGSSKSRTPQDRKSPFSGGSTMTSNSERNPPPAATAPRAQAVETAVNAATGEGSSQFSDLVTINADERTNAIIVAGTTNDIALLKRVIKSLDIVLAQVRIDVLIAEVTLDKDTPRGIDAFKVAYDSTTNKLDVTDIVIGGLTGQFSGTLQGYSVNNFTYEAAISATLKNSNVNLLSAPNILTTHNQPASIIVGQAVPIISSTINQTGGVGGVTPITNVNYEEVALTLDVTPLIGPNNVVQLELKQAVNDIVSTITVNGFPQPIIGRREASSYVSVRSGEMVVIGGLQKNSVTKAKNRIPLIGEIPLISELFVSRTNKVTKQELLIFLRPVVLRDTSDANANALQSIGELKLNQDNVELLRKVTGVQIEGEKKKKDGAPAKP